MAAAPTLAIATCVRHSSRKDECALFKDHDETPPSSGCRVILFAACAFAAAALGTMHREWGGS